MNKVLISTFIIAVPAISLAQHEGKKPNVLFILTDDLQSTSIHNNGCDQVISPNIDGLYDRGVSFTNTYNNGSIGAALSMPSRAMLMTGRGVYQVVKDGSTIPKEHTTLPELLRSHGYQTFGTGKWHSDKQSFNRSFSSGENIFFGGMHSYKTNGHVSPLLTHYDSSGTYGLPPFVGEKFSSEMFADAAIDFLSKQEKDAPPFFLFVSFTSPHDPRNQHPKYGHGYRADTLDIPVNFLPQHPFDNGDMKIRDEVLTSFPRTKEAVQHELAGYYGMISEVDVQIGRLLATLEEKGQAENTIIIFTSDNGLAMGQHGLFGKQNLYQHSVRVPLVIASSDLENGTERAANCYLYDLFPTICEMINVEIPTSVTGRSFFPVLKGDNKHRNHVFLAYSNLQRALVKEGWKYIIYNVGGVVHEQLFNLQDDPWEMINYAEDPNYAFKVSAYRRILKEEMIRNNDFCDIDSFYWWGVGEKIKEDDAQVLYTVP